MTKLEALAKSRPSFTTMQISRFLPPTTPTQRNKLYKEITKEQTNPVPYYSSIIWTLRNAVRDYPNDCEARVEYCLERLLELESRYEAKKEKNVKKQALTIIENNILALKKFISCKGPELTIGKMGVERKYNTYSHDGKFFDVTFTPDVLFWTPKEKRGLLVFRINKEPIQKAQSDFILAMAVKYLEHFFPDDEIDREQCGLFDVYADEFIHAGNGAYVNTWKSFDRTSKEIGLLLLAEDDEAQEVKVA